MNTAGRLITVSNRLRSRCRCPPTGKLCSCLPPAGSSLRCQAGTSRTRSVWIGWSGAAGAAAADRGIADELTRRGLVSVGLSPLEVSSATTTSRTVYCGHSATTCSTEYRLPSTTGRPTAGVNQKFADAVVAQHRPGIASGRMTITSCSARDGPPTAAGRTHRILSPRAFSLVGGVPESCRGGGDLRRACSAPTSSAFIPTVTSGTSRCPRLHSGTRTGCRSPSASGHGTWLKAPRSGSTRSSSAALGPIPMSSQGGHHSPRGRRTPRVAWD